MLDRVFLGGMGWLGGRDGPEGPYQPLAPRPGVVDIFLARGLAPMSNLFASNLHVGDRLAPFEEKSKPCT